jgi:hypothetical protein
LAPYPGPRAETQRGKPQPNYLQKQTKETKVKRFENRRASPIIPHPSFPSFPSVKFSSFLKRQRNVWQGNLMAEISRQKDGDGFVGKWRLKFGYWQFEQVGSG